MANTQKGPSGGETSGPDVTFEEALKKLESIVESMEGDDLPLETLLSRYEEGNKLAQICQTKLSQAELKIQQLEKGAGGQPVLKSMAIADEVPNT